MAKKIKISNKNNEITDIVNIFFIVIIDFRHLFFIFLANIKYKKQNLIMFAQFREMKFYCIWLFLAQ